MDIRLLETAKEDLREGWSFYEQNAVGLGDYFLDCMQADVRSLKVFADIHEMADGSHRMLAKRFPFAVYNLIENKKIDVYAILDCRRDPEWIVKRLGVIVRLRGKLIFDHFGSATASGQASPLPHR